MQRDGAVRNMVLGIFLRVIAQSLQFNSPGALSVDKATLHIGAIAFIHRFGSSLNEPVHFHVCVVDGVFEEVALDVVADADAAVQASSPGVVFHRASAIDAPAVVPVQADLRRCILRAFVGRGLIESCDAKDMLAYQHSGFSVDAGVCIKAHGRGRAWGGAARQRGPNDARAGNTQALTGALSVGSADRSHLRSVPAAVANVRWADASDCVHHRGPADRQDPRSHRGGVRAPAQIPGTRATAVGWLSARCTQRTANHSPDHQTLVVNLAGGAANRLLHAD